MCDFVQLFVVASNCARLRVPFFSSWLRQGWTENTFPILESIIQRGEGKKPFACRHQEKTFAFFQITLTVPLFCLSSLTSYFVNLRSVIVEHFDIAECSECAEFSECA